MAQVFWIEDKMRLLIYHIYSLPVLIEFVDFSM